jgi:hypothetical protein
MTVRMEESCIARSKRKVMGGCLGGRRPVGKPRDGWVDAIWRNALDTELEGDSKEERRLEERDRGGHGPKMG